MIIVYILRLLCSFTAVYILMFEIPLFGLLSWILKWFEHRLITKMYLINNAATMKVNTLSF